MLLLNDGQGEFLQFLLCRSKNSLKYFLLLLKVGCIGYSKQLKYLLTELKLVGTFSFYFVKKTFPPFFFIGSRRNTLADMLKKYKNGLSCQKKHFLSTYDCWGLVHWLFRAGVERARMQGNTGRTEEKQRKIGMMIMVIMIYVDDHDDHDDHHYEMRFSLRRNFSN